MRKKEKLIEENARLTNRVKEMEQILCPFDQHDFVETDSVMTIVDGVHMTGYYTSTLVCKTCHKTIYKISNF